MSSLQGRGNTPSSSSSSTESSCLSLWYTVRHACCVTLPRTLCPCLLNTHQYQQVQPNKKPKKPIYSLGLDDDSEDEFEQRIVLEMAMTQKEAENPQQKQQALDEAVEIANAIKNGDFSSSHQGSLTSKAVKILFKPIGVQGMEILAQSLQNDKNIELFELGINEIDTKDQSLSELLLLLRSNDHLKTLSIWGNSVHDTALVGICRALESNRVLTSLYLNNNELTDKGMVSISELLRNTTSLTLLDLSGNNKIGDEGAKLLADALEENHTLTELCLGSNSIATSGATRIAQAISNQSTPTLKCLDINSNLISDEGVMALVLCASKSQIFEKLVVFDNMLGAGSTSAIADVTSSNPRLVIVTEDPDMDYM